MSLTLAEFTQADAALSSVDVALEAAISRDKGEAERWWGAEVWDWLTNREYRQEKGDFDNRVNELVARARDALTESRGVLNNRFGVHKEAPANLTEDSMRWRKQHAEVDGVLAAMQKLSPVEGWSGDAANDYGSAVEVQVGAVKELQGVMRAAADGAYRGALLNRALFAIAANSIIELKGLADVDLPGGDGVFYLRTARWGDYLVQLPGVLNSVANLDNVRDALTMLNQQLGKALTMAELLQAGQWPTGTEAAGTVPADIGSAVSGNPISDTNFDVPNSDTPGVCTDGARRG